MRVLNWILTAILIAAILVSVGIIIYINATPNPRDKFTEFYILNSDGRAANYPGHVKVDEPVELLVGVVNHEMAATSYHVRITSGNNQVKSIEVGTLPNGGKWEQKISFMPLKSGPGQKYEFFLYSGGSNQPHIKSPLVLILDVD
jgi:uncharacterized membrane protein